jgi:hypothetical protein
MTSQTSDVCAPVPSIVHLQAAVWMLAGTAVIFFALTAPFALFATVLPWTVPRWLEPWFFPFFYGGACLLAGKAAPRIWPATARYRSWVFVLAGMVAISVPQPWAHLVDPADLPQVTGLWDGLTRPALIVSAGLLSAFATFHLAGRTRFAYRQPRSDSAA